MNKEFSDMKELKGILIGGPGPTKETFFDGNYLHNELKKKVMGLKDLSYTGEFGLKELVEKSHDLLAKEIIVEERKILDKFFGLLATETEKVAYGEKEVRQAIKMGAVETLILSEMLDEKIITKYEEEAENIGADVKVVSTETREGIQLKELGGFGAILRFAIS
jgi:peptide chain release factor subunit 1